MRHCVHPLNVLSAIVFFALTSPVLYGQTASPTPAERKGSMNHVHGSFEVKLTPQTDDKMDSTLGRMTIEKVLHGDLEATSKGQMLTGSTDVKGSAVYVAVERVTGTLNGRSGSFILYHNGVMSRGTPQLAITVAPDSGTGELTGITGTFNVTIKDGKHFYDFDYTLP